jgi:phage terminase large subunit-like protein
MYWVAELALSQSSWYALVFAPLHITQEVSLSKPSELKERAKTRGATFASSTRSRLSLFWNSVLSGILSVHDHFLLLYMRQLGRK